MRLSELPKTFQRMAKVSRRCQILHAGKNVHLGSDFPETYFTNREADCMMQLILGRTFKEAAQNLKISPRTVERYTDDMRYKMNCQGKSDLIAKVLSSDFIINYFQGVSFQRRVDDVL